NVGYVCGRYRCWWRPGYGYGPDNVVNSVPYCYGWVGYGACAFVGSAGPYGWGYRGWGELAGAPSSHRRGIVKRRKSKRVANPVKAASREGVDREKSECRSDRRWCTVCCRLDAGEGDAGGQSCPDIARRRNAGTNRGRRRNTCTSRALSLVPMWVAAEVQVRIPADLPHHPARLLWRLRAHLGRLLDIPVWPLVPAARLRGLRRLAVLLIAADVDRVRAKQGAIGACRTTLLTVSLPGYASRPAAAAASGFRGAFAERCSIFPGEAAELIEAEAYRNLGDIFRPGPGRQQRLPGLGQPHRMQMAGCGGAD